MGMGINESRTHCETIGIDIVSCLHLGEVAYRSDPPIRYSDIHDYAGLASTVDHRTSAYQHVVHEIRLAGA